MWSKQSKTLIAFALGLGVAVTFIKPALPQIPRFNLIIALGSPGEVKFQKPDWSNFQPASIGDVLRGDYRLLVGSNATVEVLCSNWTTWKPERGKTSMVNEGCPATGGSRIIHSEDYTGDTRGRNNQNIPYLLSPRNTSLLDNRPTLRWHQVEGAESYSVRIRGQASDLDWKTDTRETKIVYSGEQPLPPGYYWLIVETDNGQRSIEEGVFGFRILDKKKATTLLKEVEELQQKQLSEEANSLALAHFYLSEDLKYDAIDILEQSIKDGNNLVATYQLLGDTYTQVGLNRLAKERYLKGLELAQAASDLNSQAEIQKSLVIITLIIDSKEEALQWLEQAQVSYRALGDQSKVRQLEQQKSKI
ncbi:MAG: tetratricopeptide repeat protein [Moorea sp. SIO3G5]|nr:tetratricopeptide repeat protein [Moorena sp. SIO3G5]